MQRGAFHSPLDEEYHAYLRLRSKRSYPVWITIAVLHLHCVVQEMQMLMLYIVQGLIAINRSESQNAGYEQEEVNHFACVASDTSRLSFYPIPICCDSLLLVHPSLK